MVKGFQTVLLNKAKTSQVSNDSACTGEAAILQTFVKHLKSHYVLPNVDSHLVTYHPWVANNRQSQHWGRREEVPTGKSWISWLKRRDMKKPRFQSSVSTKFEEYFSHYSKEP